MPEVGGHGREGRLPTLQAPAVSVSVIPGVRIESRERGDRRDQHRHGMGIVVEPVEELLEVLVDPGCVIS
jgi:hypothetical protein